MVESRGWGSRLFDVINHALVLLLALACIIPLIHLAAMSFSDRAAATGGFVTFWPIRFTTVSYQKVFEAGAFWGSFVVSVQRTLIGSVLQMVLTVLTAYPLSKSREELPGRQFIMWFVLFAMFFSGGLIPWYLVIRNLKMLNTLWALIIPNALPIWNVILMMNFFREIPREMEEAAIIDGASYWSVLYHVYLPLSVPALATLTLFSAVNHWNAWFDGMILISDRSKIPLQTFLRGVVIRQDLSEILRSPEEYMMFSDRSIKAAQIIVTVVPILVVYPFVQKYFIAGIRLGAIKG
jgi:putative aldouronate transport system permease protein